MPARESVSPALTDLHATILQVARGAFIAGCTAVSLMVVRVGSYTLGDVLILMAAGLILLTPPGRWLPHAASPSAPLAPIALLTMVVGGWLATMVSPNPTQSMLVLVRLIILAVVVPWEIQVLFPTTRRVRTLYVAVGVGAALNGAATIAQMAFGVKIPGSQISSADRYSGLTANVSDTGAICALGVVVGFGLLGHGKWRKQDIPAVAILALSLIGTILSGSVSGMIAGAMGIALVTGLKGIGRTKLTWAIVVMAAGGALGSFLISLTSNGLSPVDRALQVFGFKTKYADTNTSASRMVTIQRGWESFSAHPFTGIGLDIDSSTVYMGLPVHNLPVALLHVGGIFFAAGVLGVVAVRLAAGLRTRRVSPLAALSLSLTGSALWFSLTAPGYYNRYFWIPVALTGAVATTAERSLRAAYSDQG